MHVTDDGAGMEHYTLVDAKGDVDLYVRLSKAKEEKLATVGVQVRHLTSEAAKRGERVRAIFADDGISAWDEDKEAKRPGFLALLKSMRDGKTKSVAAVEMDRYSRRAEVTAAFLAEAHRNGVALSAGGARVDTDSPMSRAMAQIGGVLAEMESSVKSERIKRAHDELARQGKFHGGLRPFGYNDDGVTPHETEAPLYRELVERIANGETPGSVARDWKERGILNRRGVAYKGAALGDLVRSQRHAGLRVFHGEVIGAGAWEALVTPELQARAVGQMRARSNMRQVKPSIKQGRTYEPLVQGMVVCGACGAPMNLSKDSAGHPRYACTQTGCGKVAARVWNVDDEVTQQFLYTITRPRSRKALAKLAGEASEVTTALARIDKLTADLAELQDMLNEGEIERGDYRAQVKGLTEKRRAAERELQRANVPALLTTDPDTLGEKWYDLTLDERRANVAALMSVIVIHPHTGTSRKVFQADRVKPQFNF